MRVMKLESVAPIVARFLGMEADSLRQHFFPATEDYLPQIITMRQVFICCPPLQDEAYLRWRYQFTGPDRTDALDDNRIWVFTRDGTVLGFVGVEAIQLRIDGGDVKAAKVMDLVVRPEVDGKGLGVWMNLALQQMGRPIIALGSNKNSLGIVSKLFHRLPSQKVYKNILNSSYYFSTRSPQSVLIKPVSLVYDFGLRFLLLAQSALPSRKLRLEEISRFDHNRHGPALAEMNHFGIQLKRDCDYLNWRLFDNPRDRVEVTGLWLSERLVGYLALAYRMRSEHGVPVTQVFVLDWGLLPGERYSKLLVATLRIFQRSLQRQGIESISAFSYDARSDAILRRAGLHRREDETKTVSIFVDDPKSLHIMQRADEWFLTGADTDYA